MPEGGAAARARQCAHVSRLAHERMTSVAVGRLLDALAHGESLPRDSDDARLIAVVRREYEKAIKVPAGYVARANAIGVGLLRRLDQGAAGERLRRDAPLPRADRSISAANTRASSPRMPTSPTR